MFIGISVSGKEVVTPVAGFHGPLAMWHFGVVPEYTAPETPANLLTQQITVLVTFTEAESVTVNLIEEVTVTVRFTEEYTITVII